MGLQESLGHPHPHPYSTDASPWVFSLDWQWQKESHSHLNDQPQRGLPTVSDSLLMPHTPFHDISTLALKKLLETQVPTPSALPVCQLRGLKKQSVCIWFRVLQETSWKQRWEDWTVCPGSVLPEVSLSGFKCFETQRHRTSLS